MRIDTDDFTIKLWKRQLDTGMRMVEAFSEGSIRMRETQLKAANQLHETMDSARKLLDKANSRQDLWRIQSEWSTSTLERTFGLWSELSQEAAEAQSKIAKLFQEETPFVTPVTGLPQASKTALVLMDEAYRRWRDTTLQFYTAVGKTAENTLDAVEEAVDAASELTEGAPESGRSSRGGRKHRQE